MPTYEYACRSCGEQLEVVQSFTDDPLTTCGACGGPLRKVFGAVGISFKGSGFYKTDSRKGSSSSSGESGKDGGDGGAAKKEGAKEPAAASSTSGGDGAGGSTPAAPAAASKPSSAPSSAG